MPYPTDSTSLPANRSVGAADHVTDHNAIAAEINAIKSDLLASMAPSANLSAALTVIRSRILPAGGTTGQVLSKSSGTDYAVSWASVSSGQADSPVVLKWTGSAYPTKPAGVNFAEYQGPTDPATLGITLVDGDVWLDTDASEPETRVVTADIVNATTTLADITSLSYPVLSGVRYSFAIVIGYIVNATTTGTRFVLNGPATSFLTYQYDSPTATAAATTRVGAHYNAYLLPAAAGANTPFTSGNTVTMTGTIIPSANGNLVPQFSSEVAVANAVTIKAGSLWIVRS